MSDFETVRGYINIIAKMGYEVSGRQALTALDRIEAENERLRAAERLVRDIANAPDEKPVSIAHEWQAAARDVLRAPLGEEASVPRVTDAERAEAQRVREAVAEP